MYKNVLKVLLLLTIFAIALSSSIFAFSDNLFEFNLPDSYSETSEDGVYLFINQNDSNKGIIITAKKIYKSKKSVWDLTDDEIESFLTEISSDGTVVESNNKAKLNNEKAIMIILKVDSDYIQAYILNTNKYIYLVLLTSDTLEGLNDSDYTEFKNSFVLKDKAVNSFDSKLITYVFLIIVIIVVVFMIKNTNKNNPNVNINNFNDNDNDFNSFNDNNDDNNPINSYNDYHDDNDNNL